MKPAVFRVILLILIFLSGAAALTYQIVWTRMLLLVFGSTTHSVAAVLSAFMAGLALGSALFGKKADTTKRPLLLYGKLELTIGVFAGLTPFLIKAATGIYAVLYHMFPEPLMIFFLKMLMTFVIILPPTIAMGGTLPVIVRFFTRMYGQALSREVGLLYAVNTLGGLLGVGLTGYALIELIGLTATALLAMGVNITIGIVATILSSKAAFGEKAATEETSKQTSVYPKSRIYFALSVFALEGLISMVYEVAWTRLLTPTMGTYIYAFSLILILFLLGIAIGSFLYEKFFAKQTMPFLLLGLMQTAMSIGGILSILAVSQLFSSLSMIATAALVILPATIAMGAAFPIVTSLSGNEKTQGSFVGTAYALNTIGSLIGPLIGSFVLLKIAGSVQTILLLAVFNALFGLSLTILETAKTAAKYKGAVIGVAAACLAAVMFLASAGGNVTTERNLRNKLTKFSLGTYRYYMAEDETAHVLGYMNNTKSDYGLDVDGVGMSVLVDETKLMSHLPLVTHPNPQDMLVIAFGMGTTFRSALTHDVAVDAVELVPSVPKAFPIFFDDAAAVLTNPKGTVIINDGRNYVLLTQKKYDIITVDPPPPVNSAGTTVLYSQEFYEQGKRILRPGGIFAQWFFYGTREDDLKMLIKSFINVFPYVSVFHSPRALGLYALGSDRPITVNREAIAKRLTPKVRADLNEWGQWNEYNLASLYFANRSLLATFAGDAPPVTDDRPRTEYFLLRHYTTPSGIARDEVLPTPN